MVGRLLVPDGRLVAICPHPERVEGPEDLLEWKTKYALCTITAVDPATGYFFAMGHIPERKMVGQHGYPTAALPELRSMRYADHPELLEIRVPQPQPLCGPVLAQNQYGILGRMPAAHSFAASRPTSAPQEGEAVILTGRLHPGVGVNSIRGRIEKGEKSPHLRFVAETELIKGMSGAPVLQGNAIVGVLFAADKTQSRIGYIKPIDSVVVSLLTEVDNEMQRSVGQSKKHSVNRGGSGRTVERKSQQNQRGAYAAEVRTAWARRARAHTGAIFYQQLVRDGAKMAELERQVHLYERGRATEGILLGGRRLSYKEALTAIWSYHLARSRMALLSNVTAGLLTAEEYRGIIGREV